MSNPRPGHFKPLDLWQNVLEPTFWLDSELRLIWVNPAWEALTGHEAQSVVGLVCHAHAPTRPDDPADLAASFHPPPEAVAGRPSGTMVLIFHAGGERIWRRVEFWPFRTGPEALIGLLGVVRRPDDPASVPDTEANRLHVELLEIRRKLQNDAGFDGLLGQGPAHRRMLEQVRLAAGTSAPVLIVGAPGTGKRLVARAIHQTSPGRNQPLVPFDSEALPAEVLERELFAAPERPEPRAARPVASYPGEKTAIDARRRLDAVDQRDLHAPPRLTGAVGRFAGFLDSTRRDHRPGPRACALKRAYPG